ncbi:hypothetical protein G3T36_17305 [Diaminobutyricibacter tongyongensis]|uniref:Uncharacterized protein n=1 Tax=Leifsonia tongyongensis TaxID=1268043 RepID=A0A6L9Y2H8_9MICO|nr:hypothetical protein [Diaminobutyricibacter tongyongensis]NEN07617.1 hypothetical protein [Diaminobutyricibacter tongyongensis]
MDTPDDWTPAFPGQRPPFQPGNRLSVGNKGPLKHGANSPVRIAARAAEISKGLREQFNYLNAPSFKGELAMYARAQARADLFEDWMETLTDEELMYPGAGKSTPWELHLELSTRAANLSSHLGFIPSTFHQVADKIARAERTMAKRAEAAQLQADLRQAVGKQMIEKARNGEEWFPGFNIGGRK